MDLTHNQQWAHQLTIIFISLAVFLVLFAILLIINKQFDPVRSRFVRGTSDNTSLSSRDDVDNIYQKYNRILLPSNQELIGRTKIRLNHAGFHYHSQTYQYYGFRFLMIIGLPILVLVVVQFIPTLQSFQIIQALIIATVMGYVIPSFVLDRLIKSRQKNIQRAFPDALDLLVVCTEAGLSLDASIQKVAEEISFSQPILAEELNLVISELRAGVERKKAMNGIAERTGVEEIRGLMSSINQSMRFGSSIAETLRIYSDEFRDKRVQAAEEKAAKIGAKLIFPTAVCLLPSFIMIVIVPFGLNLITAFKTI